MSTFLHIGYPKTATTWFINCFYPLVTNAGIIYARDISYDFTPGNERLEIKTDDTLNDRAHRIVVTHKFTGVVDFKWDHGKYRQIFIRELKKLYPEAAVIVFIRNQVDFLASVYSSYLTHGGTYTFRRLFRTGRLADGQMLSYEYMNYYELIQLYSDAFGPEKIHVFLYEDFLENNRAFLERYCKRFGLEIDLNALNFKKYNEKLRTGLAAFTRFANLFSKNGVQPKNTIINMPRLFSWMNKQSFITMNRQRIWGKKMETDEALGRELIAFLAEYYKESNNQLLAIPGCEGIKKYGYPL